MDDMTYEELAERYGQEAAKVILQTLERFSQVRDNDDTLDEKTRWQRILALMQEPVTVH